MKRLTTASRAFLLLFLISAPVPLAATDGEPLLRVSMGVGGTFGLNDVVHKSGSGVEWDKGLVYGGGLIFESMLTGRFGVHTGLWATQNDVTMAFQNMPGDPWTKMKSTTRILTFPLYLLTMVNTGKVSFNLLSGMNFSYIMDTTFKAETAPPGGLSSVNGQRYIGYTQLGVAGGIELKFRLSRFTDFFVSGIGEFYFSNLIPDSGWTDFLYGLRVSAGVLLRTF